MKLLNLDPLVKSVEKRVVVVNGKITKSAH